MSNDTYNKTEGLRRLRVLTKKLREMGLVPFAGSFEVGERTHLEIQPTGYSPGQQDEDDDLMDFWTLPDYAAKVGLRHGEVVHIYVSTPEGLEGTHCGWVGGPNDEPMVVNVDGREISPV